MTLETMEWSLLVEQLKRKCPTIPSCNLCQECGTRPSGFLLAVLLLAL